MYFDLISIVMIMGGCIATAYCIWDYKTKENIDLIWELYELEQEIRQLRENSK